MERLSTGLVGDVSVSTDTGGFKSLGGQLLQLVGHQVDTQWELVDGGLLSTQVVDSDLSVWDTSVVSGLWVRLVLTVSVASSRLVSNTVL